MQLEASSQSSSRYLWADFVRNIGILLVILGHVSGMVVQRMDKIPMNDWMAGNIYNVIARACVPLLFMVSGALLLPRQESIRDFYSKRFQRVIFPFLFWSILYLLWKSAGYQNYTLINALKTIGISILIAPAEYHLWFMYELFGVYMLTPLFRKAVDTNREICPLVFHRHLVHLWPPETPISNLRTLRHHLRSRISDWIYWLFCPWILINSDRNSKMDAVGFRHCVSTIGGIYRLHDFLLFSKSPGDDRILPVSSWYQYCLSVRVSLYLTEICRRGDFFQTPTRFGKMGCGSHLGQFWHVFGSCFCSDLY